MRKLTIAACIVIMMFMTACSVKVGNFFSDSETLALEGDIENTIITATSTVSGQIIEMNKQLGEPVAKGDVIAVIHHEDQKYAVEQLKAVVNMKEAALEGVQAGVRPQQIEQAQAVVNAAKARLEEVKAGNRPQQIEQAEAQVRAAKAQYDLVASGNRKEKIEQAKNNVSISEEAVNAQQLSYNHIKTNYEKTLSLYNEGFVAKTELDNSKYELDTTEKQLTSIKLQLESSKQQLILLQNGAATQEVSIAAANYDAAKAQLKLLQSGASEQAIRAAQADVEQATAQLKLLQVRPTEESIKAAQSDLEQATAQLEQAEARLDSYYIKALEDGIIISKNFELGDVVNIGSQIAEIATHDTYVLVYLPIEYLDKVSYNQTVSAETMVGVQDGRVSYIDLENEYTPKDRQSTNEGKPIATKIKVSINDEQGKLKSGMTAKVYVPLK